jgi:hypothetical protein
MLPPVLPVRRAYRGTRGSLTPRCEVYKWPARSEVAPTDGPEQPVKRRTATRSIGLGLVAALVLALGAPSGAGAAVQLGQISPIDPPGGGGACAGYLVQAQDATAPYTVPFPGGVITGWSHRGNNGAAGSGRLLLWGPAGGTDFTLVARSPVHDFTAGIVNVFSSRIPVNGGELLGLRGDAEVGCAYSGVAGDIILYGSGTDPVPGETRNMSSAVMGYLLNVAAVLEPDADGDGYGDESQDQCPGQAGPNAGCPRNGFSFKVKKNKKKGKATAKAKVPGPGDVEFAKNRKVKGKERSAGSKGTVKVPIKLKRKAKKKLNRRGRAKVKVKITYTPAGGKPNTKSKKVKLRKR